MSRYTYHCADHALAEERVATLEAEVERLKAALHAAAEDLERDADVLLEPTGLDYEDQAPAVREAIDALDKRAAVLRAAAEGQS